MWELLALGLFIAGIVAITMLLMLWLKGEL